MADAPGLEWGSVEVIIAETGADMSRFPSPAHLASCAALCPGNHESAGSAAGWPPRRAASGCAAPWSSRRAAAPTKDSYSARLRGPDKPAVAVAHSLLDVIWHLLTTGEVFTDLGADYLASRQDKKYQAAA